MRKEIVTAIVTGLIGMGGMGGMAAPLAAHASTPSASADTVASVHVTGGALSILASADVTLTSVVAGQASTEDLLGTVTVDDMRAAFDGAWTATAVSSDFLNSTVPAAPDIPASDITYIPGSETANSGDASFTDDGGGVMSDTIGVDDYSTADEIGVASVSWDPSIRIALPSDVVAGTYTGTITNSVA